MPGRAEAIKESVDRAALHSAAAALLHVTGMACGHCAARIRTGLLGVPGVLSAQVDLGDAVARVNFDPSRVELQALLDAVADAGHDGHHEYRATLVEATW